MRQVDESDSREEQKILQFEYPVPPRALEVLA